MADTGEIAAIIGGSIAGLIVLVVIVTIIVYILCGPRSKRRRQEKKFHNLSSRHPDAPGHHSQNSTMSHMSGERLPKVGSNGLWVGTPGVYASSPSSAYFYGRPYPPGIHRASSERVQPFPGHAVYQTNNSMSNLRIYHSQQLSPVYEYIDPTQGPNVVDIYQYGDIHHSRSRLIEQPSSSWKKNKDKHNDKKILRSKSDATQDPKRHGSRKRSDTHKPTDTKSSSNPNSKSGKSREARADIHGYKKGNKSKSSDEIHMGHDNKAFERESGLATDSMKLQAGKVNPIHNITDDEKKHVTIPSDVEMKTEEADDKHYVYQGDVYAVPEKNVEGTDNPILAKMNNMLVESSNLRSSRYLVDDEIDGPGEQETRIYNSAIRDVESPGDPLYSTPYEHKINDNIIVTEVIETQEVVSQHATTSSNNLLQPQPSTSHNIITGSPSLLSERSEVSEDLDVKGKNVTTAAFEFLESYLSDDDEIPTDSRPTSPGTLNTDQGMY